MAESFGKYLLLEKLASGGMAEVFLAKHRGAGGITKLVAIKRILPQYSENPEFIEMFKEEAKIAVNLKHSNVVSIFEFGVERGQFYLMMDFVEGQNLRQILNHLKRENKDLAIEQIVFVVKEVAAGLDHAHRCLDSSTGRPLNITHRDMSPQNVMVSFEGEVKIVDFGIAKAENQMDNTRAGTIKGKFGYMSPEQADGQTVDSRTDIFSLGIILWELIAKDRLFVAQSEAATLKRVRECQVPSLKKVNPSVPAELERICNKALMKDKSVRYQTAAQMHKDLNRFLNTQFPDFNPQDFGKFMKSVYNKMYVENRKKFADYAKLGNENTAVTETKTMTATETESLANTGVNTGVNIKGKGIVVTKPDNRVMEPLEIDMHSKKIDLGALKIPGQDSSAAPRPQSATQTASTRRSANKTYTGTYNTNVTRSKISKQKRSGSPAAVALLFVALGLYGIYHFQDRIEGHMPVVVPTLNNIGASLTGSAPSPGSGNPTGTSQDAPPATQPPAQAPTQAAPPRPEPAGQADVASTEPLSPIVVHSTPTQALVYIGGVNKGFTPYRGFVETGKPFSITLVKDGFESFDSGPLTTAGDQPFVFRTTLKPAAPKGFISIEIINGGSNPVVYVNGQKRDLNDLARVEVPASTPVKVRVENKAMNSFAEETVTVGVGRRKPVRLILGRTGQKVR